MQTNLMMKQYSIAQTATMIVPQHAHHIKDKATNSI